MKKFVLRVLAVMMIAAMMVPSMGGASKALAAEAVTLDLTTLGPVINGDAPTTNADGSLTFSGQTSMKCTFPLPTALAAGESVTVNVKLQFNSEADAGVRFYLVSGVDINIATEIATIAYETGVVEKTFQLTAASDATELLFASSGYGVYIDNVTLFDITLGDKPAEEPKEETPVEEPKEEAPVEEPKEEAPVEEPKKEAPVEEPKEEAPATSDNTTTGREVKEGETVYTVKKGDCLWTIAKTFLGKGARYTELFERNSDILTDATLIKKGQEIIIPAK